MGPADLVAEMSYIYMPWVQAAALSIARPLGILTVFPAFIWLGLQGPVRNVFALAMAAPVIPEVHAHLTALAEPLGAQNLGLLMVKEVLIGIALGAIFGAPFWAAEMAGTQIDVYRGAMSSTIIAPDTQTEPLVTGAIYALAMTGIFMASGGLRDLITALYGTYGLWSVFEATPPPLDNVWPMIVEVLRKVSSLAIALAAPLLIAMFLSEIAFGIASRLAPQVNIFDLTLSIKNLAYLFLTPAFLYLYAFYYAADVLDLRETMAYLERALE
ncbi:flagellar biosynthetic protein FliR [Neomegalonema sp.]|uniref:EscT/YscT/HrcT family type III secretion system export apparatus protein n=1 Tax=Neomegalonema sp. TaxID=2039713 RepID=UPI0026197EEF|nr:flagellar biosynthetic protein FliR [Neomegalonema sp.]MDD2868167.1 flagellar biosynthetic protein FliR [Neomegalonema sp.]